MNAPLELQVRALESFLRLLALRNLPLKRIVHFDERPRLAVRINEHVDLRPENARVNRLTEIVHRTRAVPAQHVVFVDGVGGQKQDRHVMRTLPLFDERGQLDPVHPGHLDVEHQRCKIVTHHAQQRLFGGGRPNEGAVGVGQHHLEDVEVSRLVVDD